MIRPVVFHEDTFYEYFKPYRHPDSCHDIWGSLGLETYGEDFDMIKKFDIFYVWTVMDSDSGNEQWISPGIHFVNRICYLVTENSHHGLDFEFRISSRLNALTPIGLKRQLNRISKIINTSQLG